MTIYAANDLQESILSAPGELRQLDTQGGKSSLNRKVGPSRPPGSLGDIHAASDHLGAVGAILEWYRSTDPAESYGLGCKSRRFGGTAPG